MHCLSSNVWQWGHHLDEKSMAVLMGMMSIPLIPCPLIPVQPSKFMFSEEILKRIVEGRWGWRS